MSSMGLPFETTVPVRADSSDELNNPCVSAEVFYGDTRQPDASVQAQLEPGDGLERQVRIRSARPVDEPLVSVYLTLGCNTRLVRKWVSLADPPLRALAEGPVDPAAAGPVASASAPVSTLKAAGAALSEAAAAPAQPSAKPRSRSAARASRNAAAPATARRSVARLQMDALEWPPAEPRTDLRLSPELPAATGAPSEAQRAEAAARWRLMNATPEELLRERQRLQELEAGFERLRAEVLRSQQAIARIESRVAQPPAVPPVSGWAWALGGLVTLLAGALGGLLWLRWRDRMQSADWNGGGVDVWRGEFGPAAPKAGPVEMAPTSTASAPVALQTQPDPAPTEAMTAVLQRPREDLDEPATAGTPHVFDELPSLPLRPQAARAPARVEAVEPVAVPMAALAVPARPSTDRGPRQLSVEELIDLEQQADFFVVLGQDEAAIDLLLAHVREPGVSSPLPYLKLMEIYQRRSEHIEYERLRKHFNQHFGSSAPGWDDDLAEQPGLDERHSLLGELQQAWAAPTQAVSTLRRCLIDRASAARAPSLNACRDLLLLYAVAVDLAEQDEGGVDVLLPLDEAAGARAQVSAWASLGPDGRSMVRRRDTVRTADSGPGEVLSFEGAGSPVRERRA